MKKENVYDRIRKRINPETRQYVSKNMDMVNRIAQLLEQKSWTQKEFAKHLGKTESEVSKWMSGLHNFTLKSIAKMEVVLDDELLTVPKWSLGNSIKITFSVDLPKPTRSSVSEQNKPEFSYSDSDNPQYMAA